MSHRWSSSFEHTALSAAYTSVSPTDARIRSEQWGGRLPLLFELAANEVTTMEAPAPLAVSMEEESGE